MQQFFVYILRCGDGTLYTGWTTDIAARLKAHTEGKGARYTRGRRPLTLVYQQKTETKQTAMQLEARIKRLKKAEKLALIETQNKTEKPIHSPFA